MGKFDGYLICTDLDGTFTEGLTPCADNAEYVKYFQKNGGLFTVATGRLPPYLDGFTDLVFNCPVITHNGAVIYDTERRLPLVKRPLPCSFTRLARIGLENPYTKSVSVNSMLVTTGIKSISDIPADEEYYKVVFCTQPEEQAILQRDSLKAEFGADFCIFRAWNTGVECLARNANKGTALTELRGLLGGRVHTAISVGDCENDSFMIRSADIGFAVGNATVEAKDAADGILCDFRSGAIAEIIRGIENGSIKKTKSK